MKSRILILFILISCEQVFAQTTIERTYEVVNSSDSLKRTLVRELVKDQNDNVYEENLSGYIPVGGKKPQYAKIVNKYERNRIIEKLYTNKSDTIITSYKYKRNRMILERKELIEESNIKDGLEYGDGTPNGCVVPPEALEYFKVWVNRRNQKSILKNGKKQKDLVYFNYGTNSHNIDYSYDSKDRLVLEKNTSRDVDQVNWIRSYRYEPDKITIKRKFYIEYWNKIPPTEKTINHLNSQQQVVRIEMSNMKDKEDSIITFHYDNDGNLTEQKWFDSKGELIRCYEYEYNN